MNKPGFVGKRLGSYEALELIGQGGMAEVYRAYQPSVKREVALKVIVLDPHAERRKFHERFTREAETIASLEHPHILPVFDYGVSEDVVFIAMRLLRGGTLETLLANGPLSMERVGELFPQIARALGYAHRKSIIHRDMKPSNILLDDEGNAYLSDFGLAKIMERESRLTVTGTIVGTPTYMSPEQLRGEEIDHRADIYGLGVILYEMLTGRPPFEGNSTYAIIYQHMEQMPVPPHELNPGIPAEIETVALRALQKAPSERYDNAEKMANALEEGLGRRISTDQLFVGQAEKLPELLPTPLASPRSTTSQIVVPLPGRRGMLIGASLIALFFVGLLLLSGLTPSPTGETLLPTILPDSVGGVEDVHPDDSEIALVQQRLGSRGYVALIACNLTSEYFSAHAREMTEFANSYGIPFRVYDSDTDDYLQVTLVERARAEGARALIVCVLDPVLLTETLVSAQKAGISIVLLNSSERPGEGSVVVSADNYAMGQSPGQLAGQIIAAELGGQANVLVLEYPDLPDIVERANGMVDGMRAFAPEARIVARVVGGTRELAAESVQDALAEGLTFDVILSINDAGSFGAIEVLEAADIPHDAVIIASVDAEALARQYIREGRYLRGSVAVNRTEAARAALDTSIRMLAGATLPETILVPPGELVTADSAQGAG